MTSAARLPMDSRNGMKLSTRDYGNLHDYFTCESSEMTRRTSPIAKMGRSASHADGRTKPRRTAVLYVGRLVRAKGANCHRKNSRMDGVPVMQSAAYQFGSTKRPIAPSSTNQGYNDGERIRKASSRGPRAVYGMPGVRKDLKLGRTPASSRSQAATGHSIFGTLKRLELS
jgi:hypothetical protein